MELGPRRVGLRGVTRRPVNLEGSDLVQSGSFEGGGKLPLVLEPALQGVDLTEWARSRREWIEQKLLDHGAVLFRGFGLRSPAEFEAVAEAICGDLYGEYGDLPREGVAGKVYGATPYPVDKMILFHNESSHLGRWPMKISFFCVQPPLEGGETLVVDCREVYRQLDPAIVERFAKNGLMYVRNFSQGLDVSWQDFFHTRERAEVEDRCRSEGMSCEWTAGDGLRIRHRCQGVARHPKTGEMTFFNQVQLHHVHCLEKEVRESVLSLFGEEGLPRHVYYGDGGRIEDEVIEEITDLYHRLAVPLRWRTGDMAMLDNMLTAHARNPYTGPRKIVVALGQIMESSLLAAATADS